MKYFNRDKDKEDKEEKKDKEKKEFPDPAGAIASLKQKIQDEVYFVMLIGLTLTLSDNGDAAFERVEKNSMERIGLIKEAIDTLKNFSNTDH